MVVDPQRTLQSVQFDAEYCDKTNVEAVVAHDPVSAWAGDRQEELVLHAQAPEGPPAAMSLRRR